MCVLYCDGCDVMFVPNPEALGGSKHADGLNFCTLRCLCRTLRNGGRLHDGRIVLVIGGKTPAEHLAWLREGREGRPDPF